MQSSTHCGCGVTCVLVLCCAVLCCACSVVFCRKYTDQEFKKINQVWEERQKRKAEKRNRVSAAVVCLHTSMHTVCVALHLAAHLCADPVNMPCLLVRASTAADRPTSCSHTMLCANRLGAALACSVCSVSVCVCLAAAETRQAGGQGYQGPGGAWAHQPGESAVSSLCSCC